jgi:hypothetical protein
MKEFLATPGREWETAGVGLIGTSGGARLVVDMLAIDAENARTTGQPHIFERGGLALSPALDLHSVFSTLDGEVDFNRAAGLLPSATFTQYLRQLAIKKAKNFSLPQMEDFFFAGPEIERRFFEEFSAIYLRDVAHAFPANADYDWTTDAARRCYPFFADYGFGKYVATGEIATGVTFDSYTDMRPRLRDVAAPLTIVFTHDDPVLRNSRYASDRRFPTRLREILDFAKVSGARVFEREYGSHHAYFLDTRFMRELLVEAFKPSGRAE